MKYTQKQWKREFDRLCRQWGVSNKHGWVAFDGGWPDVNSEPVIIDRGVEDL